MNTVKPGQVWEDVRTGDKRRQIEVERVEDGYAYVLEPVKQWRTRVRVGRAFRNYRLVQDSDGTPLMAAMEDSVEVPEVMPYLTIIEDRSPKQKAHTGLGQARKAILYRLSGVDEALSVPCYVYRWGTTGWEILWKIPAGTRREDMPWLSNRSPKA